MPHAHGRVAFLLVFSVALPACVPDTDSTDGESPDGPSSVTSQSSVGDFWNSATIYFLLTDRFHNGDESNDFAQGRQRDGATLRSFLGGDFEGVTEKLEAGYFDSLGVSAIWMTPFVEQILGSVDEGTGKSYGFHGYWTRDWTAVEPTLGTRDELVALVESAHRRGIRVLMDAVINHTGPVTPQDPQWPDDWVRAGPRCVYEDYATTVHCTLVDNLPDIRTGSDEPVQLPGPLVDKWTAEGRLEQETVELDVFFSETGYPRAPRYYIIKWLTDWVRELGIDGYRVDTSKHFEEGVSIELRREADRAFAEWKEAHPDEVLDDLPFFMMGEVYNYDVANGRDFDFGDRSVDFFDYGYDGLINFGFKRDATGSAEDLFSRYAELLDGGPLDGTTIVNYVSSHDDGDPFDRDREDPFGAGTRLLLSPGAAQIYYGDEVARALRIPGAEGDAHLRSPMDWASIDGMAASSAGAEREILTHWRKLGRFRRAHPAVGAGEHRQLQSLPYIFSRTLDTDGVVDRVLVAMDQADGVKSIPVFGLFDDGSELLDAYSGQTGTVADGEVDFDTPYELVLLSAR